ncbi:hypothetical protein GH5_07241 [Leishmania sp. Ghana 2012 LV757]|uniref:hypothetical protein n=1 Tax=Leishmania sp. Ghana 2012 LV757 TaxID=2803181 RepID=UPI001B7CA131|nr:hypothetical protein GH5_07241 [Leishmania sp. Ghana 2012 LV757]
MKSTESGTNCSTHAPPVVGLAKREERLVVSLDAFLHAWAEGEREGGREGVTSSATTAAAVARDDEQLYGAGGHRHPMLHASDGDAASKATVRVDATPLTSTSVCEYLATLPPRLPGPLPRSFRPNEMVPGVYLGSWSDVGTSMLELAQRLRDVSAGTHESLSYPACRSWQRLVLLVRACPLKGIGAPRLELHVTRRCDGKRRSRLPRGKVATAAAPARLLQQLSQRSPAMHSGQRPGATMTTVPTDEDVVVMHMSLSEVYERLCATVAKMSADPVLTAGLSCADVAPSREDKDSRHLGLSTGASSGTTSSSVSTIARWLCPDSPLSSPSRSASSARAAAAYVPSGCTPADRHVFVDAMQCMLLEEEANPADAAHRCCSTTELRYWRLVIPILDSPGTRIEHYIPMTNLIVHAALTLGEHPQGRMWLQGKQREVVRSNAPTNGGGALVDVNGEGDASGKVGTCTAEATVFPCVAVHCQAGKSRSVAFVAAFLMEEWMWWYRGCYPLDTAGAGTVTAEQSQQQRSRQGNIARRLVDTIYSHLRSRRLCIDINIGFDTQLWEMMSDFVRSL